MSLISSFAAVLPAEDHDLLPLVQDYFRWQEQRREHPFTPDAEDDVDLRTYLLEQRTAGQGRRRLVREVQALRRFYRWAHETGLIPSDPFEEYDFSRPFLSQEEIRRRQDAYPTDPQQREIARLQALNSLAQAVNRAPDLQTALDVTLETLVGVMELRTAWAFLRADSGLLVRQAGDPAPVDDFQLAATYNLPPGLRRDDYRFLKEEPDCHCQYLIRSGRMRRAVNVVECSRLNRSALAGGDNEGLFFHASTPIRFRSQTVGVLNFATEDWQFLTAADLHLLSTAAEYVSAALERSHLYDQAASRQAELERELQMARQVQTSLLPDRLPVIPGFQVAGAWRAARQVAGDFYDVFRLPDGRWALLLGDVTDKGAPAALYMAMTRSLIRAQAELSASPAAVLNAVNQLLVSQSSASMFATVFFGLLDPQRRILEYALAGHPPPLVRTADGTVHALERGGPVLGLLPEARYTDSRLELPAGILVMAYTDGLTDALDPAGQLFDLPRVREVLAGGPQPAEDALANLLAELEHYVAGAEQADDITLLALSCTGSTGSK